MVNKTMLQNITNNPEDDVRSVFIIALLASTLIILIFLSVCGNLLVVLAVLQTPSLREDKSNYLVINLAVSDILNGLIVMLSTLMFLVIDLHTVPSFLCNLTCAANYCLIITSMLTLCFISIDRFYAVVFPLTYVQRITSQVIVSAIAAAWIQGVIFAVVPIAENWIEYDYWEVTCAIQWHKKGSSAIYYVIAAFILCFLLPGLVLTFNYVKILREAKRKIKVWAVNLKNAQNRAERRQIHKESASSKTIRSLLIVVFTYFICMTPFSVTKLIKVSVRQSVIPGCINTTASCFEFASSVVNPFIYGIFRRDFRQAFRNIIRKRKIRVAVTRSLITNTDYGVSVSLIQDNY